MMASIIPISQSQPLLKKGELAVLKKKPEAAYFVSLPMFSLKKARMRVVVSAKKGYGYPVSGSGSGGEGFVEEMRFVAMKLHTRDQAKEGERETDQVKPVSKWEPSIEGYLKFLVDSKLVYCTLERIVDKAAFPDYGEFRKTGLERSESLGKDLEWFKEQQQQLEGDDGNGIAIPEPSSPGINYSRYLEELSEKDPQAFISHFYNTYFAHTAGGRIIGRKVAEKILNGKELEFYKWDGDVSQLLQNVRDKLNRVAERWSREEKDRCLEETKKSFKFSGDILRLILSSSSS